MRVGGSAPTAGSAPRLVICPYCAQQFDLFAAPWCAHAEESPSKICPQCERCLCTHPAYRNPQLWKDAPLGFRRNGFQRLFLLYV